MPKPNIAIIWTLIFELYVVKCGSNNGHHMFVKEIKLCAQHTLIILDSTININGGTYIMIIESSL